MEVRKAAPHVPPGTTGSATPAPAAAVPEPAAAEPTQVQAVRFAVARAAPVRAATGSCLPTPCTSRTARRLVPNCGGGDLLGGGGRATDHQHAHWVPIADGVGPAASVRPYHLCPRRAAVRRGGGSGRNPGGVRPRAGGDGRATSHGSPAGPAAAAGRRSGGAGGPGAVRPGTALAQPDPVPAGAALAPSASRWLSTWPPTLRPNCATGTHAAGPADRARPDPDGGMPDRWARGSGATG